MLFHLCVKIENSDWFMVLKCRTTQVYLKAFLNVFVHLSSPARDNAFLQVAKASFVMQICTELDLENRVWMGSLQ